MNFGSMWLSKLHASYRNIFSSPSSTLRWCKGDMTRPLSQFNYLSEESKALTVNPYYPLVSNTKATLRAVSKALSVNPYYPLVFQIQKLP